MLAEEQILIVPFAYHRQSGLNGLSPTTDYNINCINFTQLRFGLTNHRISAEQKAMAISSNTMRQTALLLLTLLTFSAFGQNYPFAKDFVKGAIIFKDSSQKQGQVQWFPHQNEKLKFRKTENGETIKYSPEEIAGFSADTLKFVSLYNFDAYADNYALLGKTSNIKHTFGQLLDAGKFNVYFVIITGYNAISGAIQTYPNFLFQNTQVSNSSLVAYPFAIRMKDKKYDKAKENLYVLFKEYPNIVDKLKNYKQQDDFSEIINMIKAINRQ